MTKLTINQIVNSALIGITAVISAAVFVQMLGQAATLGQHGEKLSQIEQSVNGLAPELGSRFDKLEASLALVKTSVDMGQTDLRKMIAKMGFVGPDQQFEAVIYDGSVWAFPTDKTSTSAFEAVGLKREQVNGALYGYRVMSIETGSIAPAVDQ